jgi:hypothetical protein
VYVKTGTLELFRLVSESGLRGLVIAPYDISVLVPAFTSLRVYAGHPTFTIDAGVRRSELDGFYVGDERQKQAFVSRVDPEAIWVPKDSSGWDFLEIMGYKEVVRGTDAVVFRRG